MCEDNEDTDRLFMYAPSVRQDVPTSVAQLDVHPTGDQGVVCLIPARVWQHSFIKIDHEIFSTIILSLPLIQEGQLSVSGKSVRTSTGSFSFLSCTLFHLLYYLFYLASPFLWETTQNDPQGLMCH